MGVKVMPSQAQNAQGWTTKIRNNNFNNLFLIDEIFVYKKLEFIPFGREVDTSPPKIYLFSKNKI